MEWKLEQKTLLSILDARSFEDMIRHHQDPHVVENPPDNIHVPSVEKENNQKQKSNVFFDVAADDQPLGRIEILLYEDVVPKTARNFKALAKGV